MPITENTFKGYYEIITNFTIHEFIVYYFTIYVFIILIERTLKTPIDTDGKFKTNPKILLGLLLIFFAGIMETWFSKYLRVDNLFLELLIGGSALVIVLYLAERLLYGTKNKDGSGLIAFIYTIQMKKIAKSDLVHLKKEKIKKKPEINNYAIYDESTWVTDAGRERINLLITNSLVSFVLGFYYFSIHLFAGIGMILVLLLFLYKPFKELMAVSKREINARRNRYIKIP